MAGSEFLKAFTVRLCSSSAYNVRSSRCSYLWSECMCSRAFIQCYPAVKNWWAWTTADPVDTDQNQNPDLQLPSLAINQDVSSSEATSILATLFARAALGEGAAVPERGGVRAERRSGEPDDGRGAGGGRQLHGLHGSLGPHPRHPVRSSRCCSLFKRLRCGSTLSVAFTLSVFPTVRL